MIASVMIVALVAFTGSQCYPSLVVMTSAQDDDELNLCGFHHIKKFDSNGKLITSWGEKGNGDGQFLHPHGIALDREGNVYVTDEERQRRTEV